MQEISHFQVRGVSGAVNRVKIGDRIVDYWSPKNPTHLLIAHDGQNVFDPKSATKRFTWRMAQNAEKVFGEFGFTPPAIIGIFHSSNKSDPFGRYKDLTPQKPFLDGVKPLVETAFNLDELRGDKYQNQIAEEIVPSILNQIDVDIDFRNRAMIGSSMGGLATLYALGQRNGFFRTALAFSPHWVIGGNPLVDHLLNALPKPGQHKVWMSRGNKKLDSTYKPHQDYADKLMANLGWQHQFKSVIFNKAGHNERAWAKQVDDAFRFWLLD